LKAVSLPGENPRFVLAGHGHHHHVQCTRCVRVFDVHACPGGPSHLLPNGFTVGRSEKAHARTLSLAFRWRQGLCKGVDPAG
jgi:hypothetical protein